MFNVYRSENSDTELGLIYYITRYFDFWKIIFVNEKKHYHKIELYLLSYKKCLTTLIKIFLTIIKINSFISIQILSSGDPTIEVYFNDNCFGKSSRDRCNLNQWSAEIVIKNDQSGVKNVISEPTGIQPKTNFIAGTKSPVYFYYTSTCCNKIVNLRVIDINQKTFTKTVDVTGKNTKLT